MSNPLQDPHGRPTKPSAVDRHPFETYEYSKKEIFDMYLSCEQTYTVNPAQATRDKIASWADREKRTSRDGTRTNLGLAREVDFDACLEAASDFLLEVSLPRFKYALSGTRPN
jgi:hypothetical protein